ncbi:archaemetzincin-2-like [Liolophura sinensis]|uniref:archaemetzincin-2-like n=1 Tax=Liolophura sinensis TaxID=3198878 RepID=UPI0031591B86
MCPCVMPNKSAESRCMVFYIGKLQKKSSEEKLFYQLAYKSLHKVRLGRKTSAGIPHEGAEEGLFKQYEGDDTDKQQTYIQWRAAMEMDILARLTAGHRTTIYIQPIGTIPASVLNFSLEINNECMPLLDILRCFTEIFFTPKQATVLPAVHISEAGWVIGERTSKLTGEPQLLVRDFYPYLFKRVPRDGVCIMGLSWLDLYPCDKLNFVLGESSCAHKAGVFSFGRFDSRVPQQPSEGVAVDGPMLWQLLKTLTHEVCHLLRLEHCPFFWCTMNASHTVREAMEQPLFLCPVCMRKVQKVCRFSLLERYTNMSTFLKQVNQQCQFVKFMESIEWLEKVMNFLMQTNNPR